MEIMWDIPFYPCTEPTPWHISCPTVLQVLSQKSQFTINLALRRKQKENSQSKSGRKQKKERKFLVKDRKKTKEIYRKVFGPDNIWTIQNCHQVNKKKKGNHDLKWSSPFDCQPKSYAPATFSPRTKQKQKRKRTKKFKAKIPTKNTILKKKSYWSMIMHVIFDLIGNNLQNQVMAYLWFGIRMKHLPMWDWYTLSGFLLFLLNPVFPLNGHLEMKCWHPKSHLWLWEDFISILPFPGRHIVLHPKSICCSD